MASNAALMVASSADRDIGISSEQSEYWAAIGRAFSGFGGGESRLPVVVTREGG
jgi:hypothetical protein